MPWYNPGWLRGQGSLTEWHLFSSKKASLPGRYSRNLVFVEVLHAIDLHNTKSDFKGWGARPISKSCVSRVYETMIPHSRNLVLRFIPLGLSVSVLKINYQVRREESHAKGVEKIRPYNYCFRVLWDRLLSDRNSWVSDAISQVRTAIRAEGVSFILERGHENNTEGKTSFSGSPPPTQAGGGSGVSLLPCQTRFSRNPAGGLVFVLLAQERHKPSAG